MKHLMLLLLAACPADDADPGGAPTTSGDAPAADTTSTHAVAQSSGGKSARRDHVPRKTQSPPTVL